MVQTKEAIRRQIGLIVSLRMGGPSNSG
jgi:hypothetical protein